MFLCAVGAVLSQLLLGRVHDRAVARMSTANDTAER
jgi:hypothetical protein